MISNLGICHAGEAAEDENVAVTGRQRQDDLLELQCSFLVGLNEESTIRLRRVKHVEGQGQPAPNDIAAHVITGEIDSNLLEQGTRIARRVGRIVSRGPQIGFVNEVIRVPGLLSETPPQHRAKPTPMLSVESLESRTSDDRG